jgi:hypothetical protein
MPRPRSEKVRRQYGFRVDPHLMKDLEFLSVDQERYMNELLEEAIKDLLKKYKEKAKIK